MKKLFFALSLLVSTCVLFAVPVVNQTTASTGTTNSLSKPIVCTFSSGFAASVSLAGISSTVGSLVFTNTTITNLANQTFTITLTNNFTNTYTFTNSVSATNQVNYGTNSASAATNLYTKLASDCSTYFAAALTASNTVQLTTLSANQLAFTWPAVAGTSSITTNAIAGSLNFKGSNSLDGVLWFRDSSKDFSLAFSSTNLVTTNVSYTGLPPYNYWTYGIENATTNGANGNVFQFVSNTKVGL